MPRTGAAPSRPIRKSDLLLGWRASDLSLNAYTGQTGRILTQSSAGGADVPGEIQGRNGSTVVAGRAQPRWEQIVSRGNAVMLGLQQDASGKDIEMFEIAFPLKVMSLSLWLRVWPGYTAGSSVTGNRWLALLGNDPNTSGGYLGILRTGLNWYGRRVRVAATIESLIADAGAAVWPLELLVTLAASGTTGTIQLSTRTSAATPVVTVGPAEAGGTNMVITTETWGNSNLYLATTAHHSYEAIKLARNVHTFASIDALT
jgi:hypothetical protein